MAESEKTVKPVRRFLNEIELTGKVRLHVLNIQQKPYILAEEVARSLYNGEAEKLDLLMADKLHIPHIYTNCRGNPEFLRQCISTGLEYLMKRNACVIQLFPLEYLGPILAYHPVGDLRNNKIMQHAIRDALADFDPEDEIWFISGAPRTKPEP